MVIWKINYRYIKKAKKANVDEVTKMYSNTKYPYTTEIIDQYRKDFHKALLAIQEKGKPCLTEEQVQRIVDSFSDGGLAYDMQWHSPEELAEINTM